MKDVEKINFNLSSDWIKYYIFHNEELWERKHIMNAKLRIHFIQGGHYKNITYVQLCQKVNIYQKKRKQSTCKIKPVAIELKPVARP